MSFKRNNLPQTPNAKTQLTGLLAPNNLRDGGSPHSLIGTMAEEIQKELNSKPETADQIFASVNEDIGLRLKNSRTNVKNSQDPTPEKDVQVTATEEF